MVLESGSHLDSSLGLTQLPTLFRLLRATHNPVFSLHALNVRDPAVWIGPDAERDPSDMTYHVFFTGFERNAKWKETESWSIRRVLTRDWVSGGRGWMDGPIVSLVVVIAVTAPGQTL